jgi:regulator of protease activity HflC (stomatin/prohibitin superfamily)
MNFLIAAGITFMGLFIIVPIIFALMRTLGFYAVVEEGTTHVYVLFGKVAAVLDEPGFYILWFQLGPAALIVNWLGKRYVVDRRLDQTYLRSQAVNSEEGAPMGLGVWYEMWISDPVSYLFKNTDPRGSLAANVSSATVRCLSNLKLEEMLENRHTMSYTVRTEVAPKSRDWGFDLGSIYIRKVHFRDAQMIRQIEEKVVNRLRRSRARSNKMAQIRSASLRVPPIARLPSSLRKQRPCVRESLAKLYRRSVRIAKCSARCSTFSRRSRLSGVNRASR